MLDHECTYDNSSAVGSTNAAKSYLLKIDHNFHALHFDNWLVLEMTKRT